MTIRPGPPSITSGACPGGIVIHVYAATDPPVLLASQRIGVTSPVEQTAEEAANLADAYLTGVAVCLVAYDGDSGDRYSADDWTP